MTSEPVWAGVVAVVVAGEPVGARLLVGGALVLLAMYVVELGPRLAPRPVTRHAPARLPVRAVLDA
jgi:drug/metabolite transporter (DMT)-like permease